MNINLFERIEKLLIGVPTTSSVSYLLENIYADIKRDTTLIDDYSILEKWNGVLGKLRVYDYIPEVDLFIKESEQFFVDNNVKINSLIALKSMVSSGGKTLFYTDSINLLQGLVESKTEEELPSAILESLGNYTWIPEIKNIYHLSTVLEKGLTESDMRFSVKSVYSPISPIFENDIENYIIYSSGRFLKITDDVISEVQLTSMNPTFRKLCEAVDMFNVKKNKVSANFYGTPIEIVNENDVVSVYVDSKEIDASTLMETFMFSSGWSVKNEKSLSLLSAISENMDNIIEIEMGKKITSTTNEGISLTVFKYNKKVYLQKVNSVIGINEFNEMSVLDAINECRRYMGVDITTMVSDLLEESSCNMHQNIDLYKKLQEQTSTLTMKRDKFILEAIENDITEEYSIKEAVSKIDLLIEKNIRDMSILENKIGSSDVNVLLEGTINTNMGTKKVTYYGKEYLSNNNFININIDGHWTQVNKKDING